jgi:2-polyprenyl-6-methoxyphenol hydroxylase-like FAD-dependent oxidoreductase
VIADSDAPVHPDFDVIIVGAGFAGAAAATVLGREQFRVALIDPRPEYPPEFKAEKIEADHADGLRRLHLAEQLLPSAARIHTVVEAHDGRVLRVRSIEQYGMRYHDIVGQLRKQIPGTVDFTLARVDRIDTSTDLQSVILDDGSSVTARLVVMAAGTAPKVETLLGVRRRQIRSRHSLCVGFDITRADGTPFPFDALTYWADSLESGIDFISLFPVPGAMRVNLFGYLDLRDPWLRVLIEAPQVAIGRAMPKLARVVGEWRAISRVEIRAIDLYVTEVPRIDGVVLVGDAWQSVCPATGTGLGKVLTDVEVLCRTHIGAWLDTPGMRAEKIASYYNDARKTTCDDSSLRDAEYRRRFVTERSLRWRIHRASSYARIALAGIFHFWQMGQ